MKAKDVTEKICAVDSTISKNFVFDNAAISIQQSKGHYCGDNTVEIAMWLNDGGGWITKEWMKSQGLDENDNVYGYCTLELLMNAIHWTMNYKPVIR